MSGNIFSVVPNVLGSKGYTGMPIAAASSILGEGFLNEAKDTMICGLRFTN